MKLWKCIIDDHILIIALNNIFQKKLKPKIQNSIQSDKVIVNWIGDFTWIFLLTKGFKKQNSINDVFEGFYILILYKSLLKAISQVEIEYLDEI